MDINGQNALEEVCLFNGAYLVISPGMGVKCNTENGQAIVLEGEENSNTQIVKMEMNKQYKAGVDFEPGVYDLIVGAKEGEYPYVSIEVLPKGRDFPMYIDFSIYDEAQTFYNVPLEDGAEIYISYGDEYYVQSVLLVPSVMVSRTDMNEFYDAYWY